MAKRKLMTIEDLVKFCREQNFTKFSSKESGYKLAVQVPTTFEIDENVDEAHRGMLKLKFRIFHTGLNRNGSFVSEESAKDAMPTIKNRPIMAAIHQLDNGEWDFEAHNMEIVKNEETGEEDVVYIEKQVGSFDESEPFFEYDEELDKTYVCSYGYIPEDYTKAADIIRRKGGTKNSCELSIDELSFNAKESYLSLDKFYVAASTLLGSRKDGTEIGEGMLGSRADIADFSEKNNSMFSQDSKLVEVLEKLNTTLSNFQIDNNRRKEEAEVELGNFEEVIEETVEITEEVVEEVTEEVVEESTEEVTVTEEESEETTEETPEVVVEEVVEETTEEFSDEVVEDETGTEETSEDVENEEVEKIEEFEETDESDEVEDFENTESEEIEQIKEDYSLKCSVACGESIKEFSISLSEKISAISTLVNETYESDGTWYCVDVYDDDKYVIMQDCWSGRAFKQSYKVKKDSYSLVGDRVEVYSIFVTEDERKKLDEMRANYSSISAELSRYQKAELDAQKEEIISDPAYVEFAETDEFKEINKNIEDYSLDELKTACELAFAKCVKKNGTFSLNVKEEKPVKKVNKIGINTNFEASDENEPYGDYFKSLETY